MYQLDERQLGIVASALWDCLTEIVAVISFDPEADYPFVHINAAFERSTGWTRDQVIGRPMHERQPPEVVGQFVRYGQEALDNDTTIAYQVDFDTASGKQTFQVTLRPLPDLQPEGPPALLTVMEDVTALTRTLAALSETQQLARIGHWWWDVDNDEIHWSSELYRIFGIERGDFDPSYEGYLSRLPAHDRERADARIRHALASGEPFELTHDVVRPDGSTVHVWGRGEVTLGPDGQPVRMAGTAQDITEQHRVETELSRQQLRLRAALDHASEFLGLMDLDGTLLEVNRAPLQASGLAREDVIGRPFWQSAWWSGDDEVAEQLRADVEAAAAGETVSRTSRYFTADGATRWVDRTVTPIRDDDGEIVFVIATGRDVTDEQATAG